MASLAVSDLVFSEQANHNFSRILGNLKRANLSITNRLRSVREDADFVSETAATFGRPLVANERCGSWYVEPGDKAASAYFKSTDGHAGQWKFSTRRLNLHLLPLICEHDGCIIVDSTRRGKRIPDALSKTIPTWCCVLNNALFPELAPHELYAAPQAVSASEHSQMQARVPEFVRSLERLGLDLPALRRQLRKPLRPLWVNPPDTGGGGGGGFSSQTAAPASTGGGDEEGGVKPPAMVVFEDFHPVICCTSSRRVIGTEMSESGYIQGAGDDTENWAHGLAPPVFWAHADRLLSAPEADLPDLIKSLVSEAEKTRRAASGPTAASTELLSAGGGVVSVSVCVLPTDGLALPSGDGQVVLALLSEVTKPEKWRRSAAAMDVGLGRGKIASRNLRQALPRICDFIQTYLRAREEEDAGVRRGVKILVGCETGKDISVGVVLALACRCFAGGSDGMQPLSDSTDRGAPVTKDSIRVQLGRIMMAMPGANPSRATLQSVNSFLMNWGG